MDRIVINNIEEEEDENIDVDTDKVVRKEIEYHPEVVVSPPRQMNKSLSELSNIGNDINSFYSKYMICICYKQVFHRFYSKRSSNCYFSI